MKTLRWGILSSANIGQKFVIPALKGSEINEVAAIASRNMASARSVANQFDIPRAYDSYEDLLADPDIDAIYNPLPNHLHVPLSIAALEAGKHVLCEKPLGLTTDDAQKLVDAAAAHPNLRVMEAFMYRFHPQWRKVQKLISTGELGRVGSVHAQFTYYNDDPHNIRNRPEWGGGGLLDIGSYCTSVARLAFASEPLRVCAKLQRHPEFGVDILSSGMLEFANGYATFTCATQLEPSQFVHISGDRGSIQLERPFYKDEEDHSRVFVTHSRVVDVQEFEGGDHYMDMVDAFSQAIFNDEPAPTPLADAIANMRVIDAAFASAKLGQWVDIP